MGKTVRMSRLLAVTVLLFGLAPAYAGAAEPIQVETISQDAWLELWQEVTDKPYTKIIFEDTETLVEVPDESAVYIFTKPSNLAYPAVIKRETVRRGSETSVEITGASGGSLAYFEVWAEGYFHPDQQPTLTLAGGGSS